MNPLASALAESMASSPAELKILDRAADSWQSYSWSEVHARARQAASLMFESGSSAIGLVGEPTIDLISAVFGALISGHSLSILPPITRGADPSQWASATSLRFLNIGAMTVLSNGSELASLTDNSTKLAVHDVSEIAHHSSHWDSARPTDVAVLQGTAGSTGHPRTATLSPHAVLSNALGLNKRLSVDAAHDVGCLWLPLYHDMGLACLISSALAAIPLWLAPTTAFAASPFRWLRWLHESRATITAGPNFAYNLIGKYASRVSDVDLSSVRVAINGGEPIDCDGFSRFLNAMEPFGFPSTAAAPAYGLAESVCAVTMPTSAAGLRIEEVASPVGTQRHAILGHPIEGVEIRSTPIDDGPSGIGHIEIRGSSLMNGYLGGEPIGHQNWFSTGDLGYLTGEGLIVCGRVKEVIWIAGRNIFPAEVERVVAQIPGVRAGAVVAVGTPAGAARPGLIVAAEFRGKDSDGARRAVVAQVAAVCGVAPSSVTLMAPGSLPRTSSGKLRRLEVQRQYVSGQLELAPS